MSALDTIWTTRNQTGGGQGRNNQKQVWCGAGVYIIDNKKVVGRKNKVPCLLVFRERNRSLLSGVPVWEEPGGKLEPEMETVAHGASAELLEESRNWLKIEPSIFLQSTRQHVDIWSGSKTALKGYRAYWLAIEGLKKNDYLHNAQLLDKRKDEVPHHWLETDDLKWVPVTEFLKKKLVRKKRQSWRGRKESRAIVKDYRGKKIEVSGRLMLGMRNYRGGEKILAWSRSKKNKIRWHLKDFKDTSDEQRGFLKGTRQYRLNY